MLDECQDRRSCQVLVNSRVFGADQCPGSSKYLIVWYKCRPSKSLITSNPDHGTRFCLSPAPLFFPHESPLSVQNRSGAGALLLALEEVQHEQSKEVLGPDRLAL